MLDLALAYISGSTRSMKKVNHMTTRRDAFGSELEAVYAEFGDTLDQIPDNKWQAVAPVDGRQINVLLDHAVNTNILVAQMIEGLIAGGSFPSITGDDIEHGNQQHMAKASAVSRAEVQAKLNEAQATSHSLVSKLTDDVLDRSEYFGPFGGDVSVETIVQVILVDHVREHLGSVQSAIAG
jgi:hypothetical protein